MKQYHDLLTHVLTQGVTKGDRTGTGTRSVFGYQMRFDLNDGFPLVTTKKVFFKSVLSELLWFLAGSTDVRDLRDLSRIGRSGWTGVGTDQRDGGGGSGIWDHWVEGANTDLGPVYGAQWRRWQTADGRSIDQIRDVIEAIKTNPDSRRLIVNAWNVADIARMRLPPCHLLFQFYVAEGRLSCQLYQRSADIFIGVPFNIASYALLTMMVAHVTGLKLGEFVHTFGDAHLYLNHLDLAREQLSRALRPLPTVRINPAVRDIDEFRYEDIELIGYDPHPYIRAAVAV